MDGLTNEDEKTIRRFLTLCLADGFYAFIIDGTTHLLESKADIERITTAIKQATPPVIRFRVTQAIREILELEAKHPELAFAV